MARKTRQVRIMDGDAESNRDFNKTYVITEMPALEAERWAADAFQGLVSAGVDVPDDLAAAGIVAVAQMGLKAIGGMPSTTMHSLMDRMLDCVTFLPDPQHPEISRGRVAREGAAPPTSPMFASDIEEISTYWTLRRAVLDLHGSFMKGAVRSLVSRPAPALTPN